MPLPEGTLRLDRVHTVARDTLEFFFTVTAPTPFGFVAGQFLSLEVKPNVWRAYSIASLPGDDQLILLVRIIPEGVGSQVLSAAQSGAEFRFRGPFGHFGLSPTPDIGLTFCATGTGIAPLRALILTEAAQPHPRPMRLWYGGRDTDDIAYLGDIAQWASTLDLTVCLSRQTALPAGGSYRTGRITDLVTTAPLHDQEFYLCGNGDMVKDLTARLIAAGVSKNAIKKERFN